MPRPRKNIPLGLDQPPNIVIEPAKIARMTAEFRRRLDYAKRNYEIHHLMENDRSFNASLRELRSEVAFDPDAVSGKTLNMEIMGAIYLVSRHRAEKRGEGEQPTDDDRREARRFVAERLKLRQGQWRNTPLTVFVEGMMALLQETSGKPVAAGNYTKSVYDPQPRDWMANLIIGAARAITPWVTATRIIGLIIAAQRKYAGKSMSFEQFYPGYGAKVTPF